MIKEFLCTKCGTSFEKRFNNFEEFDKVRNQTPCTNPACEYTAIPMVSQTARPQFKGGGFYETDYK